MANPDLMQFNLAYHLRHGHKGHRLFVSAPVRIHSGGMSNVVFTLYNLQRQRSTMHGYKILSDLGWVSDDYYGLHQPSSSAPLNFTQYLLFYNIYTLQMAQKLEVELPAMLSEDRREVL